MDERGASEEKQKFKPPGRSGWTSGRELAVRFGTASCASLVIFLQKLEIRDYALRSAGGLSEATPSCSLLISVFSIIPDFLVFAALEPRSQSHPYPRAEYALDTCASLFSDLSLY